MRRKEIKEKNGRRSSREYSRVAKSKSLGVRPALLPWGTDITSVSISIK